jgi:hypothetical protein
MILSLFASSSSQQTANLWVPLQPQLNIFNKSVKIPRSHASFMVINNSRKGKSDQYRTLIKKPQLGTELDFNDYHTQNICGSAKSLSREALN